MGKCEVGWCRIENRFNLEFSSIYSDQRYSNVQKTPIQPADFASNLDALDKGDSKIRRLQAICQIEKRIIEHRSRILSAQREIIDVNKTLIEIKNRLHELSNM